MAILTVGLGAAAAALAENWPAWRGAGGNGAVADQKAPAELSMDKNLKWKVELPGRGCSTPVVWDGQIIVTTMPTSIISSEDDGCGMDAPCNSMNPTERIGKDNMDVRMLFRTQSLS